MSALQVLLSLGIPYLVGAGLLRSLGLRLRDDRLAYPGQAYLVGMLVTACVLFLWLVLGGPPEATGPAAVLFLLAVVLFAVGGRTGRREDPAHDEARVFPVWERALFAASLLLALFVSALRFATAALSPVHQGDEGFIWAAKAKAIFLGGGFSAKFAELCTQVSHPDYPILNPLLQVWTFAHAGSVLHVENRFPIQGFVIALFLVFAASLRRHVRPALAAVFLLQLLTLHITDFYGHRVDADVMVALGFFVVFDALLRWRAGEPRAAVLIPFGLAFLVASKNEGYFYVLALVLGLLAARLLHGPSDVPPMPRRARLAFLVPALLLLVHLGVNAHFDFTNDLVVGGTREVPLGERLLEHAPGRVPATADYLLREIVLHGRMSGLWMLAFGILLVSFPRRAFSSRLAFASATFLFVFAGQVAVYALSQWPLERHLETSAGRFLFQALPALALWLALISAEIWPRMAARAARSS